MAKNVAIGIQSFSKLIENDCFYVDKTDFIRVGSLQIPVCFCLPNRKPFKR